ncbi:hypothetical protein FQA39_LY18373 [Lamprigera yunnana]|nr:hypothetical protein FQA39_LY18373 [Lamprigera yunnana]
MERLVAAENLTLPDLGLYFGISTTQEEFEEANRRGIALLQELQVLPTRDFEKWCPNSQAEMKTITDRERTLGWRYRCNGQAGHRIDPTVNTFMERARMNEIGSFTIILIIYSWLIGTPVTTTMVQIRTFDTMWKSRKIGSKTITFEIIEEKKILKIEDMSGNEVYLSWESVSEVSSLESVLRYRSSYSSGSNFKHFYEDVIRAVAEMPGDVKINIYNIINRLSEKSVDACCMLEVLLFMPEKALFDVQLERRIQEQEIQFIQKMWMLYALEHWTKALDLKLAVERLYEKLGALEFDSDHKAIYGMERYYTVQQCEDKYKVGRKVCRKFLKGKTCSQCLVKRISKIGLRHFLDTINKYIKDCSDSSSPSSDEEVFKAVEQNGKGSKTTEED